METAVKMESIGLERSEERKSRQKRKTQEITSTGIPYALPVDSLPDVLLRSTP